MHGLITIAELNKRVAENSKLFDTSTAPGPQPVAVGAETLPEDVVADEASEG